jgi:hypothetical protein
VYWIPNSKRPPLTPFQSEYLLAHSPISYFLKRRFITASRWFDSHQRQENLLSFKYSILVQGLIMSHVHWVPEILFPELHLYVNLTSCLYLELIKEWVELFCHKQTTVDAFHTLTYLSFRIILTSNLWKCNDCS